MSRSFLKTINEDIAQIVDNDLPWEKFSDCQVIVTGASGFLGNYFVRTLLALNDSNRISYPLQVLAVARNSDRVRKRFADLSFRSDLELICWDFNKITVPKFKQVQFVIHAASLASPRFYGKDPVGTLLPNTIGTAALLEYFRFLNDPRAMLFLSSSEVYGSIQSDSLLSEDNYGIVDPVTVRACYSESKRMGETMCVAWHSQYELPVFIVRPFHIYGPGLSHNDGRVFADFVFNVIRNENIIMNSDGSARRSFCYVTDAMFGFFSALLKGAPAIPYNVANPEGILTVLELAELLVSLVPEKRLSVAKQNGAARKKKYLKSAYSSLLPDVERLKSLGWRAQIKPDQGFKRMLEAYYS